jgi:hypothetical protein
MKKGDAASHAEQWLSGSRWVPGWMQSPDAAKPDDAHAAPDTDKPTSTLPDNGDAALRGGDKETENENVTDSGCPENHVR